MRFLLFFLCTSVLASPTWIKNWGLYSEGNSHIDILKAWELEKGNKNIIVAIIDSGIDPNHVEFEGKLWLNKNGSFGWDFTNDTSTPFDIHGHGTHIAGIIGATSNPKMGISGVAPNVTLMPLKYYLETNPGYINLNNTVKAINFAVENGARIINYSGGGPEFAEDEYLALRRAEEKGVLIVAAAGNESKNIDLVENYYYPCSYRFSNIMCVASLDQSGDLLKSSNWSFNRVDVAAPGENILSTLNKGRYGKMSGTSMATAFVSGIAALLLSKDPSLTPQEIKQLIVDSVDRLPKLKGKISSEGKINAYKALLALQKKKHTVVYKK